jgi:hypothetical protein
MVITDGAIDSADVEALARMTEPRLEKPFDLTELRAMVTALVERRRP